MLRIAKRSCNRHAGVWADYLYAVHLSYL